MTSAANSLMYGHKIMYDLSEKISHATYKRENLKGRECLKGPSTPLIIGEAVYRQWWARYDVRYGLKFKNYLSYFYKIHFGQRN